MGRASLTLWIVSWAFSAVACGGGQEWVVPSSERLSGDSPLRLVNGTTQVACFVYLAQDEDEDWGTDWLEWVQTLGPGESGDFSVRPGFYRLKVELCDHRVLTEEARIDLNQPVEVVLHEGQPPETQAQSGFGRVLLQVDSAPR